MYAVYCLVVSTSLTNINSLVIMKFREIPTISRKHTNYHANGLAVAQCMAAAAAVQNQR